MDTAKTHTRPEGLLRARGGAPLLALALVLGACESTPTAIDPDDSTTEGIRMTLVEEGHRLVLVEDIEARVLDALDQGGGGLAAEAAREHLHDAGILTSEADDARLTGQVERAERLEDWMTKSWLESAALLFSPGLQDELRVGVEEVLEAVEREIARSGSSRAVDQALRQVRLALSSAADLQADGQEARALLMVTRAAEYLLGLDPEGRAARLTARARALLERARSLGGDDPHPVLVDVFEAAEETCSLADEALDGGLPREALEHAARCHRIARSVVLRLSAGARAEELAEHARTAVDRASDLHLRAGALVGEEPDEALAAPLTLAASHLEVAMDALEEEAWRAAIALARSSAAASTRILLALNEGSDPEAFALRASKAITRSEGLAVMARLLAGSTPSPLVSERLERAEEGLDRALFSYRAGQWRRAFLHSLRSGDILRRLILELS